MRKYRIAILPIALVLVMVASELWWLLYVTYARADSHLLFGLTGTAWCALGAGLLVGLFPILLEFANDQHRASVDVLQLGASLLLLAGLFLLHNKLLKAPNGLYGIRFVPAPLYAIVTMMITSSLRMKEQSRFLHFGWQGMVYALIVVVAVALLSWWLLWRMDVELTNDAIAWQNNDAIDAVPSITRLMLGFANETLYFVLGCSAGVRLLLHKRWEKMFFCGFGIVFVVYSMVLLLGVLRITLYYSVPKENIPNVLLWCYAQYALVFMLQPCAGYLLLLLGGFSLRSIITNARVSIPAKIL